MGLWELMTHINASLVGKGLKDTPENNYDIVAVFHGSDGIIFHTYMKQSLSFKETSL